MYNDDMLNIVNKTNYNDLEKYYPLIKKYYKKTIETLKLKDSFDLSLIIVGPKKIKEINSKYRKIDKPTDVISFAMLDSGDELYDDGTIELGDIFINRDRVFSQAEEYGHSVKREFIFLFIHGLLHLLGYDHMKLSDEKKMFKLQDKIVGDLK